MLEAVARSVLSATKIQRGLALTEEERRVVVEPPVQPVPLEEQLRHKRGSIGEQVYVSRSRFFPASDTNLLSSVRMVYEPQYHHPAPPPWGVPAPSPLPVPVETTEAKLARLARENALLLAALKETAGADRAKELVREMQAKAQVDGVGRLATHAIYRG